MSDRLNPFVNAEHYGTTGYSGNLYRRPTYLAYLARWYGKHYGVCRVHAIGMAMAECKSWDKRYGR